MESKIGKIVLDKHQDELMGHLETYRERALELGADRAKVIPVKDIPVDDRVPLKCQIPRCFGYGTGAHCPPNTIKPAELREYFKLYDWAVFFTKDVEPPVIVRDKETIQERVAVYQNVFEIVNKVESMAFYDGHYHAFGFGAGSCRHTYCGREKTCQALEGGKCRFSLLSRPSMEAVGIDVYRLTTSLGWDIYPIGSSARPERIVKGTLAGIVIVQ